jgi:hypothetical protein
MNPDASVSAVAHAPTNQAPRSLPFGVWIALVLCFAGLALHIGRYAFLCDDAFISFRYARNFAQGHGLVFNPGFERVEGYSNFLWVMILAAGQFLGFAPERAANPLLIFFGLALVAMTVRFCWNELPAQASPYAIVIPALMLATNRSFALWCTSGLETKLFELLVVGGVLSTVREMERMRRGDAGGHAAAGLPRPFFDGFPLSAIWFALAALTRPDGVLFAGCVVLTRIIIQAFKRTLEWRPLLLGTAAFVLPVGGQFAFRRIYYDDWFPNTYYAKVGGQLWWEMGVKYLKCFSLEYAAVLWIPIIVLAVIGMVRARRVSTLLIFAAAIVPHAVYVASIGGDHFEYRVLDAYLPLIFILFFYAACAVGRIRPARAVVGAYVLLCAGAGMALPTLAHRSFPPEYRVGFPGLTPRDGYLTEFIDSTRFPWLFRLPVIGPYLVAYNDLIYATTRQFVGLRQEEHKRFLATAEKQGNWLAGLIAQGLLPRDLHIAVDCVGAAPYFSSLRTLDRVGLTDRAVARQANFFGEYRVMAHDKLAGDEYIREMGVDIAALDNVHLVLPEGHPRLLYYAYKAKIGPKDQFYAELGNGLILLGNAVQGIDALQRRLPALKLRPAAELAERMWGDHGERFAPIPREQQFGPPYDIMYFDQGVGLYLDGFAEATMAQFQAALKTNPYNPMAKGNLPSLTEWIEARRAAALPVNVKPPPGFAPGPGQAADAGRRLPTGTAGVQRPSGQ